MREQIDRREPGTDRDSRSISEERSWEGNRKEELRNLSPGRRRHCTGASTTCTLRSTGTTASELRSHEEIELYQEVPNVSRKRWLSRRHEKPGTSCLREEGSKGPRLTSVSRMGTYVYSDIGCSAVRMLLLYQDPQGPRAIGRGVRLADSRSIF